VTFFFAFIANCVFITKWKIELIKLFVRKATSTRVSTGKANFHHCICRWGTSICVDHNEAPSI